MSEFIRVCPADDIPDGATKPVEIENRRVILARLNGDIYALENLCTHDGGDMSEGKIIDGQLQCPRHGALFDIKTGDATQMPAVMGINTFDVKIENGDVLVALK